VAKFFYTEFFMIKGRIIRGQTVPKPKQTLAQHQQSTSNTFAKL